jgi:hypothetical protein
VSARYRDFLVTYVPWATVADPGGNEFFVECGAADVQKSLTDRAAARANPRSLELPRWIRS